MGGGVYPPVIIIGMHRSGTSMMAGMLKDLGLFIGSSKGIKGSNEADLFLDINDWLLQQCGGSWKHPEPIYALLQNNDLRNTVEDYIKWYLKTIRSIPFLGLSNYLRYRSPARLEFPWGWKDPRTTFTLPLWLSIFPDAKVLHIYRHGVDVANSIRVRSGRRNTKANQDLAAKSKKMQTKFLYSVFKPKLFGFTTALFPESMEVAFSLWEQYVQEGHRHVLELKDRALEIRYEDFIADPKGVLKSTADFCGLNVTEGLLADVAGKFKKARVFAYLNYPESKEFAERMSDKLTVWGY
jgi:hypothetical protein